MKKLIFSLFLAPLALSSAPVAAQTVTADPSEAAALALVDKSAAAYAKLNGLSQKYRFFNDENGRNARGTGTIEFEKSGAAKVTASNFPASVVMGAATDAEVAKVSLAMAMQKIPSGASVALFSLVQGKNMLGDATFFGSKLVWKNVRLLPDNGVAATANTPQMLGAADLKFAFYFDPTDHLLRRVDAQSEAKGRKLQNFTTFSDVQINPTFAAGTFEVAPAANAGVLGEATEAVPAPKIAAEEADEDVYWDPKIKVGTVPYALQGVDLAKFKGRVVLVDFWATWCGPCIGELPSLLKNYGKYHPRGFEVVGISLDQSRKELDGFVKARKLPWQQVFDGKAWGGANVAKYGVKGIPFTLLVGKDGKIAAINPRGEALEPAIIVAMTK